MKNSHQKYDFISLRFNLKNSEIIDCKAKNLKDFYTYEDDHYLLMGHFINLDKISNKQLFEEIINEAWVYLNSKFLIFLFNKHSNKITIISDISCYYPLYYTTVDDEFICTTDYLDILKKVPKKEIDKIAIMRKLISINSDYYHDDIISNIYKILPYQYIELEAEFKLRIKPILQQKHKLEYLNTIDLANDFLSDLKQLIQEYYIPHLSHKTCIADYSTGLDSTLISFLLKDNVENLHFHTLISENNELPPENLELIDQVLTLQKIDVSKHKYIKIKDMYSHEKITDNYVNTYKVMQVNHTYLKNKYHNIRGSVNITGVGGNNVFNFWNENTYLQPYQHFLLFNQIASKHNLFKLFTKDALDIFKADNYEKFPLLVSNQNNTTSYYSEIYFRYAFTNDVTLLHPFLDKRLEKYSQLSGLPESINEHNLRDQILSNFIDIIYIKRQFNQVDRENYIKRYALYYKQYKDQYLVLLNQVHPILSNIIDLSTIQQILNENENINNLYAYYVINKLFEIDYFFKKYEIL